MMKKKKRIEAKENVPLKSSSTNGRNAQNSHRSKVEIIAQADRKKGRR